LNAQLALVTLSQVIKRADAAAKVAGEQREYHKILSKFNKTISKVTGDPPPWLTQANAYTTTHDAMHGSNSL